VNAPKNSQDNPTAVQKNRKSFDENLVIFQYMCSIVCRKICSEVARPAQLVQLGVSIIFYEIR